MKFWDELEERSSRVITILKKYSLGSWKHRKSHLREKFTTSDLNGYNEKHGLKLVWPDRTLDTELFDH